MTKNNSPQRILNHILIVLIALGIGFGLGLRAARSPVEPSKPRPTQMPTPEVERHRSIQPRPPVNELTDTFPAIMRAIAMMESSGGKNQNPNQDGIVGIGQIERCFYDDAKEYAKKYTDDFPTYADIQGYDQAAFEATCTVARYWFNRYKADTPYLMFARYRKGPHGEETDTGRAYAQKAMAYLKGGKSWQP